MINTLPEFESRQVLTSDELNWLTCYLDTQNRQSRRFLTGSGLVGGLQVKLVNNAVQITNGIGLSSAGHIMSLNDDPQEFINYTKIRKYTLQAKEKLAFHFLSDIDVTQNDYSQSVKDMTAYFSNFKSDIFELLEDVSNDGEAIDGGTLKGKVAVLFAEIIQKELKDCEDDNCQERGKKYIFNTKVLVISKEDALLLLNKEYSSQAGSEDAISRMAYPWLYLPNINILKPVFSNFLNAGLDENTISAEYSRCIKDFLDSITSNRVQIDSGLTNIQNYCTAGKSSVVFVQSLLETIRLKQSLTTIQPVVLNQIIYDYLWCITKAYQELQMVAQQLRAKCFTNENAFPNHILLGILDTENPDFNASQAANFSIYRHGFQSRFTQSEQAEVSRKVMLFINRLQTLVSGFDDTALAGKKEIKLTTGGSPYGPLSEQTIPYYLKSTVAKNWNQWSGHPRLNAYTTNYDVTNENQVPSAALQYNSLPSGFQGNHSFFRVEGVHGQVALTALNSIFQLRKTHGLAFEVIMLRLNEKAPFNNSFNSSTNEDIESMYQIVRAETLKQINLNVNYLQSLQIKNDKFSSIQQTLINGLSDSFLLFIKNVNDRILTRPIGSLLEDAVVASNIVTSFRDTGFSADLRFKELETKVAETRQVTNTFVKKESVPNVFLKKNFISSELFQPVLDLQIAVLFFNTVGNLITSIKNNDKFKGTTDLSFYTHLSGVVKKMLKTEKTEGLFLLSMQLYCALKLHDEYLPENFQELDVQKYKDNLENELLPSCNALITFLKKVNIDFVRNDAILSEVVKGEMLDYADRIKFDDDWVKIIQLDTENKKRNGGLGVENLLDRFVKLNCGIAPGFGVNKGGTYIMVYDSNNQVIADFNLPYIISSNLRPLQYTLLENKTLTLSGNVTDESGQAVEVTLLVGTASIATDKQGFYNILVSKDTTIKIIVKKPGFKDVEVDVDIEELPVSQNITLVKSDIKTTTTVNFENQNGAPVNKDFQVTNLATNEKSNVGNGVLQLTDMPDTAYKFILEDERFEAANFDIIIGVADAATTVKITEIDNIRIRIVTPAPNVYDQNLLKGIRLTNPVLDLDLSNIATGDFITKQKLDISKTSTATVSYNSQIKTVSVKPGGEINEITFEANVPVVTKLIRILALMTYPVDNQFERIPSVKINDKIVQLNAETNIGNSEMFTDGNITIQEFKNVPPAKIENLANIRAGIFITSAGLAKDVDITATGSFISFNKALKAEDIDKLVAARPDFKIINEKIDLKLQNFFFLILPKEEISDIKNILNL